MNRSRSFAPRSPRLLLTAASLLAAPLFLLGCPKKQVPVEVDAGVAPPPEVDSGPTQLAPLEEDAGVDAGVDAGPKKPTGPGLTQSQLHVKQCCSALHGQAKAMGTSPEAAQLEGFAKMCDGMAMQVGPHSGGSAPELEPLRQILKGKPTIPAVCQGL